MVHTRLGSGKARAMAVDAEHREMKLIPWGGVAALLSHASSSSSAAASTAPSPYPSVDTVVGAGAGDSTCPLVQGKAFCFLPLPVDTTLPVHVRSGCFAVDCGRRWPPSASLGALVLVG
jgi:sacsin